MFERRGTKSNVKKDRARNPMLERILMFQRIGLEFQSLKENGWYSNIRKNRD